MLHLFEADLKAQSASGFLDIKAEDPKVVMAIPYWAWQSKAEDVLAILHPHRESEEFQWHWPLLDDVIPLCVCAVGGGRIEISPRFLPIDKILIVHEGTATNLYDGDFGRRHHLG